MQIQYQYILGLVAEYKNFVENSSELFAAINKLSEPAIQYIYDQYSEAKFGFQRSIYCALKSPIGFSIAKKFLKIRSGKLRIEFAKKTRMVFLHCQQNLWRELEDYRVGKREMFAS